MSEPKFTPGPWFVNEKGFSRKGVWANPTVYSADDELRYIAICADSMNLKPTNNLANAHLIAAAPDMYEALEQCLPLFALGVNALNAKTEEEREKYRSKAREIEQKVLAALAKARGEKHAP